LGALAVAAAILARRPAWLPLAVLVAAPFRPPITVDASAGFPIALAEGGQLGRLLPLYFVLAAGALALVWRALRPDRGRGAVRALPRAVSLPAAAFIGFACLSTLWAEDPEPAVQLLTYFTLPFVLILALVARSPFPEWLPRTLARFGVGLAVVFAAVGLWQAATRELFFFAPNLEVSNANSGYFRVTSLFGDPSLYGRHVVLGIGILLVALALRRMNVRLGVALIVLLWAGLFFSYSQSSMVALVATTLAVSAATGGRRVRRAVIGGLALVMLLGAGFLASIEVRGDSLRRETSDRTQRVEDTARVIEEHPLMGVGLGGQPRASRRLSGRDRPTPNFASHTAPLTVAAELGVVGLLLYAWLIVGGARMLAASSRVAPGLGLGLGAAFLALFVHALFYSGFLEDPITWLVLAVGAGHLTWPHRDDGTLRSGAAAGADDPARGRPAAAGAP
ncbi:MAG: O-antigen ligase family protein, partial [Actinomycetota bacterium]|nr:O-antigen ligase family protein [Actinomycetota bacterium]